MSDQPRDEPNTLSMTGPDPNKEYMYVAIPLDHGFEGRINAYRNTGWEVMPPTSLMVTGYLCRDKPLSGEVKFGIDDSLVTVIGPDGKPRE